MSQCTCIDRTTSGAPCRQCQASVALASAQSKCPHRSVFGQSLHYNAQKMANGQLLFLTQRCIASLHIHVHVERGMEQWKTSYIFDRPLLSSFTNAANQTFLYVLY